MKTTNQTNCSFYFDKLIQHPFSTKNLFLVIGFRFQSLPSNLGKRWEICWDYYRLPEPNSGNRVTVVMLYKLLDQKHQTN